jgi:hypothetical protein
MDGCEVLSAQLAALEDRYQQARRSVEWVVRVDRRLAGWAEGDAQERLAELATAIAALSRPGAQPDTAERWQALAAAQSDVSELCAESLALAQGAWARREMADGDVHVLADHLVSDINRLAGLDWDRLTVPAEREFYSDLAQVIRVSYPALGIWELPLVAHEFGHFAADRMAYVQRRGYQHRRQLLVGDAIATEGEQDDYFWAIAGEYFADAFATFATGPAYVWSFVMLRAEPVGAHESDFEHPPVAHRVEAMLEVLRHMDRNGIGRVRFQRPTDAIAGVWRATLLAAGEPADLPADAAHEVQARALQMYELLSKTRRILAYDGFHRARALASRLGKLPTEPRLDESHRITDVLNAAWILRRRAGEASKSETAAIERRARQLCMRLAHRTAKAA